MDQFRRGGLVFDVIDAGPADGPIVVLLHGFPQLNTSWDAVIPRLTARGYRCLAPNQRGYSLGALPPRVRDYLFTESMEDVRALIDAAGADRVHLVGHDFGAAVVWQAALDMPERLLTATPISVPHGTGWLKSFVRSRQAVASWYIYFFLLPGVSERLLLGRDNSGSGLARLLQWKGQTREAANRDARAMTEPGRLTAALNWYRGMLHADMRGWSRNVISAVPTMYVWSDHDRTILSAGARACGDYVHSEYRFETLPGVSHWILDEAPDALADLLLDWFAAHPPSPRSER
jgi:pimeloyl-ACP methyl ester carboxylesterase